MDRLESMRLLIVAVEEGSLSAAARKLGIPLATVSRKVSDLEKYLGAKLLNRSNRQLALTDSGHAYFAASKRILDDLDEAERAAAGEYVSARGNLIVTAPIVFGRLHLIPIVVAFMEVYPEVDIRLILSDGVADLVEENIDIALRIGVLPDSTLLATKVGEIRRVICASPAYFERHGVPASPSDLRYHRCITFEGQSHPETWSFGVANALAVPVHSRLAATTAEACVDATRLSAGLTRVLSYQVEEPVRKGELVLALEDYEPAPIPVNLVYRGGGLVPLKLRAFIDFVVPRLRARLTGLARRTSGFRRPPA